MKAKGKYAMKDALNRLLEQNRELPAVKRHFHLMEGKLHHEGSGTSLLIDEARHAMSIRPRIWEGRGLRMWGVTKTRNALDEFKGPTVRIYVFVFKEPVGAITKFYTDDACTVLLGAVAVEEPPGGALMDHDDPVRYDRAARGLITEEDEG